MYPILHVFWVPGSLFPLMESFLTVEALSVALLVGRAGPRRGADGSLLTTWDGQSERLS